MNRSLACGESRPTESTAKSPRVFVPTTTTATRAPRRRRHDTWHALRVAVAVAAVTIHGTLGHVASAALVAGWDFQTTTNGGTVVLASPSTPKAYVANFGSGTLFLNGSEGSSDWFVPASGSTNTELNGFGGSSVNAAAGFSTVTSGVGALAVVGGAANAANGKSAVFKFSMTGFQDLVISLSAQRTASGFTTQAWEFSTDGTTYSSIGSLVSGSTAGTITSAFASSGTLTLPTVTGFNNAANAFVRVTFTGASSATGNNRLDNIQFNASTFTPPSSTLTWSGNGSTAGGAGTWTTTGSNWSTTGSAPFGSTWSTAAKAVFDTSGGAVTVDAGGITAASGIDFNVDGYTLGGGGLTLGGETQNLLSVAAASTATINAALSGSSGITKTGAGTLALGAANAFTGTVTVSSGTLQVAGDSALGNAANDVVINGALRTIATGTLGSGRDVTGSGTLDIAPGTTLTSSGSFNMTAVTLPGGGTLDLQGATRSVGVLTFGTAATVNGSGAISSTGITATAVTSGTAVVNPAITFSSGDKTVSVGSGGTLVLNGDIGGTSGRIATSGGGRLVVSGSNSATGFNIGTTSATPVNGGTVVLGQAASSGTAQTFFNFGTIEAATPLSTPAGLSIGGREGFPAVLGGSAMTFSGSSRFFAGTGASGAFRLNVNNATTFSGIFGPTGGTTSTGTVALGGTGSLALNVSGTSFTDAITLQDSLTLLVGGTLGSSSITVGPNNTLGGDGVLTGSLLFNAGADFLFNPLATLTVNGAGVSFGGFGVSDLFGFSASVSDGTYQLIDGTAVINTANLSNLGPTNAFDLGGGRGAYFTTDGGGLSLMVVPEPGSLAIAGLGLAAAAYAMRRRRA